MHNAVQTKPYKGLGREGAIAKWYASNTRKELADYEALARRVAREIPPGARVLEVAPGPGYFAIELAKLGDFQISGLDISRTFVEIAQRNAREAGVHVDFRRGNAAGIAFQSESFDFILCRAAFKNFSEPVQALREMYRVLTKGGRALIIDLRKDAPVESIDQAVDHMHMGPVNKAITKYTFRFMLLKRAYTQSDFERFIKETKFESFSIRQESIGLEVSLERKR